jgi:Holliday junction resolvase RusA-like endonuclease
VACQNRSHAVLTGSGRPQSADQVILAVRPQTLILEGFPTQAQQDLLGPNRGSRRWGVAAERANVQQTTAVEAKRQGIRPVPPPVHVTYCFVVPDRTRRDWDNYALIVKPCQDGLVKAGILAGDHFAVLTGDVRFRVERGCTRLEIVIEPVV